jgi:prolyl-tRNA synthetase
VRLGVKFRDEIRPRHGILRSREFIMKDLYTFDRTQEEAIETYDQVSGAYERIFSDMGLDTVKVEADSGNIGGSLSHEFHLLCENGDDKIAKCGSCGFNSNVELLPDPNTTICPKCSSGNLTFSQGIEVGHVFYLGKKYSEVLNASFMEPDGSRKFAEMGCYGIGISRLMAAIVEANHDNDGIIWPSAVAPYSLSICHTEDQENISLAQNIQNELLKFGISSLSGTQMSSSKSQLGEQIRIATVLGTPYILIIGKKFASTGMVEIENRRTRDKIYLKPEGVYKFLSENLNNPFNKAIFAH